MQHRTDKGEEKRRYSSAVNCAAHLVINDKQVSQCNKQLVDKFAAHLKKNSATLVRLLETIRTERAKNFGKEFYEFAMAAWKLQM